VADPGVVDVSAAWLSNLPSALVELLKAGDKAAFNAAIAQVATDAHFAQAMAARGRPFGQATPYDTFEAALQYNTRDVIASIQTPILITDPDDETFWPGQSDELNALLTNDHVLVHFHREDGANFHCEPMGRAAAEFIMFDFFEDHFTDNAR
jgi:hypothetical protein